MNSGIAINGVGVVGGFGYGISALGLALKRPERFTENVTIQTSDGPHTVPVYLADTSQLTNYLPKRALRRIDHYSRMALLGAFLALEDAGELESDRKRMGVIIATGYGALHTSFDFMDSVIDFGDPLASPTLFSNSVHNAAAAHVSIFLKATGPSLTVSQFEMSIPSALISAVSWLEQGRVDSVLFGGVDEYCDVLGYCLHQFFGYNGNDIKPFDFERQSAIAGEGAAFFLLSRSKKTDSSYGFIENVKVSSMVNGEPVIPEGSILFIGADGHVQCGRRYERFLSEDLPLTAYSPLYGSMPVGPGFDMAVAALSIRSGRLFVIPDNMGIKNQSKSELITQKIDSRPIYCLKIGPGGGYGMIALTSIK